MKAVLTYFGLILFFAPLQAQKKDSYAKAATDLYQSIQAYFYIPSTNYYKETAIPQQDERPVSYLWPLCAMLEAGNELDQLFPDSSFYPRIFTIVERYYDTRPPAPGYASYSTELGGGTRFYDDNQWVGITAMTAYARTRSARQLETGQLICRFMMTGYDTVCGGGLYWEEGNHKTKNTCSNGPGVLLALQLYTATHQRSYLDTALLLYKWINGRLKAPSGLYYDNIKTHTQQVDRRVYSYNTGTMLQSGVYLFEITKEKKYLQEAVQMADSATAYFLAGPQFRDNYWFNAVLLRGLQQLYKHHPDKRYLVAFKRCVDDAWAKRRTAKGLLGEGDKPVNLVGQAGMLEILARFAQLEKEGFRPG